MNKKKIAVGTAVAVVIILVAMAFHSDLGISFAGCWSSYDWGCWQSSL